MKYIVAVSGGIDSMVLLDMLATEAKHELIIAHFDHGIREDSREDATPVKDLAQKHGLIVELGIGKLGAGASEAEARAARYRWLENIMQKYGADAIVTAHHQDDVIETMIINLIRGTGWRGLASLTDHEKVIRPLLSWPKSQIIEYAMRHNVSWRDDSTNDDVRYLRNFVRYRYVQRLSPSQRAQWVRLYNSQRAISLDVEQELISLHRGNGNRFLRYNLIMSGREATAELLMHVNGRMEKSTLDQLWHFVCTGMPGKHFVQGGYSYELTTRELIVSALYT